MKRINNNQIREKAIEFRQAIMNANSNCRFKDTMRYFPKGCCELSSDLFAYYLRQNGIEAKVVCGENDTGDRSTSCNHVWVDVSNMVIDLTADQFFGESLYCGPYQDFYNSMNIIRVEEPYDIITDPKLSADYEAIISYLN